MQPKRVPLHQFPLDKHCVLVLTFVLVKVHHLNSNYNLTLVNKAYIRCDLFYQGSFWFSSKLLMIKTPQEYNKNYTQLTNATFVLSNINWNIIPIIKLMCLVKFSFSNLWGENKFKRDFSILLLNRVKSEVFLSFKIIPFDRKLVLEEKEGPWLPNELNFCSCYLKVLFWIQDVRLVAIYGPSLWFVGLP